jgi:hypothetical protein
MDKLTNVDHSTIDYIPFRKGFYIEAPDIRRMTDAEVDEMRKELDGLKVGGGQKARGLGWGRRHSWRHMLAVVPVGGVGSQWHPATGKYGARQCRA